MGARRDVATLLQRVRAFLLGREHTLAVRFEDGLADRTQPPPEVPGGPAHLLAANYYHKRDPRREVQPPIDVQQQLLADKAGAQTEKLPTPGSVYRWD
ncbi:PREDICTED: NADH dehydrogenase [ubiquinone] 1 alpha subcomplex subunit 7 [Rhagoletis zephyria]|uniref:NADH dehydrogenase [ubiquinone] 1 alpha subcomplex subunit 7 n=1 Tax=Rhagoletis zephyria TaxID=28612 RepID=UPI0008118A3A|nr:PREDICTED: NADH dehydrogenase [ubiquinone] 1 alpha subcomplex subunit 7 [Rhagoletis zephyria]XP_036339075.1 NADH dehydrogenase [ubiquinone] 1 alpha subcomplex subunit 7 [Rhagoletis pomonella]